MWYSDNLLNEIGQIMYFLYQAKENIEEVYNNIINSIKVKYKMDATFMNSENSKISESYGVLLNFADKGNLKRSDNQILACTTPGKI